MTNEKFRVFTEIPTNEKMIVNMITGDPLTLDESCNLLNKQDQQIQQIKSIMDKELKKAFENRITHDNYAEDPEGAEYFKGYHCGVGDLSKKIMEMLLK